MMVHGPEICATRTWPTQCRYCGEKIFIFTCEHDCCVLFEDLGPPWPKHSCQGTIEPLIFVRVIGKDGAIVAQVATDPHITFTRQQEVFFDIEEDVLRTLKARAQRVESHPITKRHALKGDAVDARGVVRELLGNIDVYKRLSLPRTTVAATFLRDLGRSSVSQVTVHTGSLEEAKWTSYTFFVPSAALATAGVRVGSLVDAALEALHVPGYSTVWYGRTLALVRT
jgi:hypothetical protein